MRPAREKADRADSGAAALEAAQQLKLRNETIALYVDDITLSAELLTKKGFTLVSQSDLVR